MARSKKDNGAMDLVGEVKEEEVGGEKKKLNIEQLKRLVNKKAGGTIAFNLNNHDSPTEVKKWISTGCDVLDSIICRGKKAGIPVGKISCIAGLEGTGKSYLAAVIAKNAQKEGMTVVYFDTENALDPEFLGKIGCDVDNIIYIQPSSVENAAETIEDFMNNGQDFFFVIDSLANLPTEAEIKGDYNPQSTMASKPRVMSKFFSKLTLPIGKTNSVLLVLNQLKTNISANPFEMLATPFFMSSGFALKFASSCTIYLTGRKAKSSFVTDANGYRIGSSVKAKLEKSRFGTQNRECTFKILWGGDTIAVDETEAWFEIIKESELVEKAGHSFIVTTREGPVSCKPDTFASLLSTPSFKESVAAIVEDFLITKFDERSGNASAYYNVDNEPEPTEEN